MAARQWRVELLHEAAFAAKIYIAAAVLGAALVFAGAQFGFSLVSMQTAPQFDVLEEQKLPNPREHSPKDMEIISGSS